MSAAAFTRISGATMVDADGQRTGALLLAGDIIGGDAAGAAAGDAADGRAQAHDAAGQLLLPAIIDLGVFAIDPAAFIAGGIVRAGVMPDGTAPLDDPGRVERAAKAGKPDLWLHPIAAATRALAGTELAEMALMQAAGARAVATGRSRIADSGVMARVLTYAASLGLTTITHAEDEGLLRGAVATSGEMAFRLGLPAAPAIAEAMAVARDLALVEETGAPLHFRQLTTARAFDLIRAAKRAGLPVTCGITPAHLLLSDVAIGGWRSFARLSPPLRCEDDRIAAREALADGTIDVLCSGHDPRGPEDKRLPFADAAPGMAGAQTLLASALGLWRDGVITLPRLAALLSRNPARILGLDSGLLLGGQPADVMLVDADTPWIVDARHLPGMAGNTPFDGLPLQGKVTALWKGGRRLR